MDATTAQFKKWVDGFSGCDGGGLRERGIWFCGVEWGQEWSEDAFRKELAQNVTRPQPYDKNKLEGLLFGGLRPEESPNKFKFNQIMARLYMVIHGAKTKENEFREVKEQFLKINPPPFTEESDFLKLNLFPVACPRIVDWPAHYRKATGFEKKEDYYNWCRYESGRFLFLQNLTQRYRPRLIICCQAASAIAGGEKDFLLAFNGRIEKPALEPIRLVCGKERKFEGQAKLFALRATETLLWVVPFFGRGSPLMANENIRVLGQHMAKHQSYFAGQRAA
jgi:hypothetical protein